MKSQTDKHQQKHNLLGGGDKIRGKKLTTNEQYAAGTQTGQA